MDEDVFVQNPSLTMILTVERPYLSDAWCSSLCIQTEELFDSRFPDLLACLLLIKKIVSDDIKNAQKPAPCASKRIMPTSLGPGTVSLDVYFFIGAMSEVPYVCVVRAYFSTFMARLTTDRSKRGGTVNYHQRGVLIDIDLLPGQEYPRITGRQ